MPFPLKAALSVRRKVERGELPLEVLTARAPVPERSRGSAVLRASVLSRLDTRR